MSTIHVHMINTNQVIHTTTIIFLQFSTLIKSPKVGKWMDHEFGWVYIYTHFYFKKDEP